MGLGHLLIVFAISLEWCVHDDDACTAYVELS